MFLAGSEGQSTRYYSEQTAREIDQEVKRIVDEQLDRSRSILESRRPALDAIANTLIEHEVIDGAKLRQIIEQAHPSPRLVPGTDLDRKTITPPAKPQGDTEALEG